MKKSRRLRANNEGTVYFDRGKELWRAVLTHRDSTGKRRRVSKYAKTKAAANRLLLELRQQHFEGTLIQPSGILISDVMDRWKAVVEESIAVTTFDSYSRLIENHIKPVIGTVRVSDFVTLHVESVLNTMRDRGLSASTRKHAFTVMNQAAAKAIKWGLLRNNPCRDAERPKVSQKEFSTLTADQATQFLKAAQGDRLEALYVVAIATGMRQGELLGLKWADIDFEAGTLSVRRKVVQLGKDFHIGAPKTKKGKRLIHLPGIALESLRAHRTRTIAEGFTNLEYVFCDEIGGFLKRFTLLRQYFRPLLVKAGLPEIRFHDLRHTAATLLLGENVHPKVVQETLGHAMVSITMDTYSHILPTMQEQAAGKMNQLLTSKHD